MKLDDSPVFRKKIVPWYDSEPVCLVMIMLMDAVYLFSAAGVTVARTTPEYGHHIWVPALLMLLSGGVIISTTFRLISRYIYLLRYLGRL